MILLAPPVTQNHPLPKQTTALAFLNPFAEVVQDRPAISSSPLTTHAPRITSTPQLFDVLSGTRN